MATLKSGLSQLHNTSFATYNGVSYASNDWDKPWLWNGYTSAGQDTGIEACPQDWAPSPSTASGTTEAGSHRIRYRYKNEQTGYVSNPSNEITVVVVAGAQQLTFAVNTSGTANIVTSSDAKVDKIIVEMSLVDGSAFYTALEVANAAGNAVVSISDASLSGAPILYRGFGHDPPPYFRAIAAHKGRMWGLGHVLHNAGTISLTNGSATVTGSSTLWTEAIVGRYLNPSGSGLSPKISGYTSATQLTLDSAWTGSTASGVYYVIQPDNLNTLFCSQAFRPESWAPLSFTETLLDRTDMATALCPFFDSLVICGYYTIEKLTFTNEPFESIGGRLPDGKVSLVSTNRGSLNPNCVIEVEGVVYGLDFSGCWAWNGGAPIHISGPVDDYISDRLYDTFDQVPHVCWSPQERCVRWTIGIGTDFVNYYIDTKQWDSGVHHVWMGASYQGFSDGGQFAGYGGQNGYVWKSDTSIVEGYPLLDGSNNVSTTVGTVAASPSPSRTVFTITGGGLYVNYMFGADPTLDQMKGAPCYSVGLGETEIIASNTATAITPMGTGFSQVPATGDTMYIGRIPAALYTKIFTLREDFESYQPRYMHIWFVPARDDLNYSGSLSIVTSSDITAYLYEGVGPEYNQAGPKSDWVAKDESGVEFTTASASITLDLGDAGGYKKVPIGSYEARYLQVALFTSKPPTSGYKGPRILAIALDGYGTEVPVDVR